MVTSEQVFQTTTSSQEEAAQNIDKANLLGLNVDIYKEYNSVLDAEVERTKAPPKSTPLLDSYIDNSPEKAALVKPEIDKLSYMERQWKLLGDRVFDRPTETRRASELGRKKMFNDGVLDDDQELELMGLQEKAENVSDFGIDGFWEKLPAEVAGAVVDMGRGIKENIGVVGTAVGTGAFIGAGAGLAAGGVGAIPGGIAGAGTGLSYGIAASMAIDGANQMMGSMYNTLGSMMNEKGEMIEIPHEDKYAISVGVGITSGAITGLLGKKLVETVPFLNKFMSPKAVAKYVTGPNSQKFLGAIKGIAQGFASEGGEEALQETIQIVAEEFGRTYDGTEASYLDALWKAKERIAGAGVVGGLAGASISAGGQIVSAGIETGTDKVRMYVEKRTDPRQVPADKAIAFKETLNQIAKVKGEMKLKDIAPGEMAAIERKMLENAGFDHVYFNKEDLNKLATNQEKADQLMSMLDPTGKLAASMNAEVQVPMHSFIETQAAFPELADVAKHSADAPNAIQAENYLKQREEMRNQRQTVLNKIQAKEQLTPEDLKVIEDAQNGVEFDTSNLNEDTYLNRPVFTDAIAQVLGKGEKAAIIEGQLEARQNVSEQIQEAAQAEMDGIIDIQLEETERIEYEQQRDRIKDDPDVALVEKFVNWHKTPTKELSLDKKSFKGLDIEAAQAPHVKEGYSPLAIDPRMLPENLKNYAKDKNLKSKKVFVKGGISPEKAATLLGFDNARDLLDHLQATPTRAELVSQRVAQRAEANTAKVKASVSLEDTSMIQNYRNKIATAKAELQHMLDQDWSSLKRGIKRIALPMPEISSITAQAVSVVRGSTIRSLNAKMWDRGAVRSKRLAVDAVLKNEIPDAFMKKENEISNLAMAAETRKAFKQVNDILKLVKQLKSATGQEFLNRAGKELYQDPVNTILETFSFTKSDRKVTDANAYENYVAAMRKRGEAPVQIPDAFLNTPTSSYKDLTVDQMLAIGNTLKNISHLAEFKNKLMLNRELTETVNNIEAIGETLLDKAKNDERYNENNSKRLLSSNKSTTESAKDYMTNVASKIERAESVVQKFDNAVTGLLHNLVIKPIKDAEYEKINFMVKLGEEFKKHVEIYGKAEFDKLGATLITVPEFANFKNLKDGKITKAELVMMLANMGNDGNIKRLENFGVSRDTIKTVLERELDHKDMVFVQNAIWNVFESFKPKIREVHRTTEGVDPDFIEAKPIVFKGREYPGGYFKLYYDNDANTITLKEAFLGTIEKNKLENFTQKLYSQAMTKQSYLEERTGSENVLSLSMHNIGRAMEEQVHDMFMRVAVRDTVRILSHDSTEKAITNVLGKEDYQNVAEFVMAAGNETEFKYASNIDSVVYKALNHVGQGFQTVAIVGKLSTAFVQPTSLIYTSQAMGLKGTGYLVKNFGKLTRDLRNIGIWYKLAEEIHPPIKAARENMDRDVANAINQNLLKNKMYIKSNKAANIAANVLVNARDVVVDLGFGVLGTIDNFMKMVTAVSAYEQAINGHADNVPAGDHDAAVEYARSIIRTTLTTGAFTDVSPAQRTKLLKPILFFYNDANNVYNYFNRKYNKVKQDAKAGAELLAEGEKKEAVKRFGGSVAGIMTMIAVSVVSKLYQDEARKYARELMGEKAGNFNPDLPKNTSELATYVGSQSWDEMVGTVPILRDMEFASSKTWQRTKTVEFPLNKAVNDTATSYAAIKDYLKGMVMYEQNAAVTDEEKKALLKTMGYILKLPIDSVADAMMRLQNVKAPQLFKGEIFETHDAAEKVKEATDNEEVKKAMELIQEEIGTKEPADASEFVPEETYDVIKQIESGGKWFVKNPNSSAFGLYQFTEDTWLDLMRDAPELGLTEDGRISEDTSQQETAMRYFTSRNAQHLMENDIEPTIENLYVAHFLGRYGAVKVLGASDNTKLKTLVGKDVIRSNHFKNSWKVQDFKDWVSVKIDNARQKVDNNPQ